MPHPGPTAGVDLWWSGKHDNHGGNVQVVTVPDGWPIWTSDVRPGREHDTTAIRTQPENLPALTAAGTDLRALGDLGYEGEPGTITVAFKKQENGRLTLVQQQLNTAHNTLRAGQPASRATSTTSTTPAVLTAVAPRPYPREPCGRARRTRCSC